MVDHQSPGPTQPEARGGDSLSPSTSPELQHEPGMVLLERLEALEGAVDRLGGILTEQLPRRLAEESGARRNQLSELASELGTAFRRLLEDLKEIRAALPDDLAGAEGRISGAVTRVLRDVDERLAEHRDAIGARVEEGSATLAGRLDETAAALRTRQDEVAADLRARVDESAAAMAGRLEQAVSSMRSALDELGEVFQVDLGALRVLPERLAEGMSAVREAVGEIAAAHGHIEERMEGLSRAASGEEIRARVDETSEALAARLGEAAGKLRWEVQDALNRVQEQLVSLAEGMQGVRADAQERSSALQAGLERVDNLAEAIESIGRRRGFRQVVESDERFRREQAAMVDRLSDAGEQLSGRLEEVKQELEDLRKAAHDAQAGLLAEEIRRRVVDEIVTEEMVKTVLERIQQSFERSFAELSAQVDARLATAGEPSRRGLFRRAREQA